MKIMTLDLLVAEEVRYMIESGQLKPGDKLPSERELSEKFQVQRLTLRSGLQMMEEAGLIYSVPRSGYYVANRKIAKLADNIQSTTSAIVQAGRKVEMKLIKFEEREIDKYLYTQMNLPLGTRLYEIKRLRSIDGVPVSMDYSFIPKSVTPGLETYDFKDESLYKILNEDYGIKLTKSKQNIVVVKAEENYCYDLGLTPNDDVILQSGVVYDQNDQLVEFAENYSTVGTFEYVTY